MDFERAIETERVRLLRLLTWWLALVGVLSGGPFQVPLPRWVCGFLDTLLPRAELAAQCLLTASTCLHRAGNPVVSIDTPKPIASRAPDDVPSSTALLRRMTVLRDLLENLSRYALRQSAQRQKSSPFDWTRRNFDIDERAASMHRPWFAPRLARPPDIGCGDDPRINPIFENSLPVSGREALVVC